MFNVNKVLLHDLHQLVLIYGRELDFLKSCYISMNSLYKSFCSMNVREMSLRLFWVFNSIATIFPAFISHAAIRLRDWQWSSNRLCKLTPRHWWSPSNRGIRSRQATANPRTLTFIRWNATWRTVIWRAERLSRRPSCRAIMTGCGACRGRRWIDHRFQWLSQR